METSHFKIMTKYRIFYFITLFRFSFLFAKMQPETPQIELTDSLMQYLEAKAVTEFGINSSYTLAQTAKALDLDLSALKQQLGLEQNDPKLDRMRLRQLGISIYNVLLAQETIQYGFNGNANLKQISGMYSIPVKKLKSMLNLDSNDRSLNDKSLVSLNIPLQDILRIREEFNSDIFITGSSILLAGMTVVFVALLLTYFIISLLRHLNTGEKTLKTILDTSNRGNLISKIEKVSNDEIIAAITAVHLHLHKQEERRRIALTFQRSSTNYWRAAGKSDMPNTNYRFLR